MISVTFDAIAKTFSIHDNGCGISDFATLMTIGDSGWDEPTAAVERPYGMGFMSAIYAADEVEISSLGRTLKFSTQDALNYGQFEVESSDQVGAWKTSITLRGFEWKDASASIKNMCMGFPLPVTFNGEQVARPHALDDRFAQTEVGHVLAPDGAYPTHLRVFLQGFQVWVSPAHYRVREVVIHLDSKRFHGKFPDRDKVLNQDEMVAEANSVVRSIYNSRLKQMKATLAPLVFCQQAYELAESLGELRVFNDIPVAPASWLSKMYAMPHSYWELDDVYGDVDNAESITLEEVNDGRVVLENLSHYEANEAFSGSPAHVFAYAVGALSVGVRMDPCHWLKTHALIHDDSELTVEVIQPTKSETLPWGRLNYISQIKVILCSGVLLRHGQTEALITEPFARPDEGVLYVPMENGTPKHVGIEVLKQIYDYRDDQIQLRDDCDADESALNQFIMEMAASTPLQRVQLLLQAATRDYALKSMQMKISIDGNGKITVDDLVETTKSIEANTAMI